MDHKSFETLRDELVTLLVLATCGDAGEAELTKLNSLLRDHEDLRQYAVGYLRDEALLREELQVLCAAEILGPGVSSTSVLGSRLYGSNDRAGSRAGLSSLRRLFSSSRFFIVGLAACLAIAALSTLFYVLRTPVKSLHLESMDSGVAVLTKALGVEWEQEVSPQIGDTLPPGDLRLKSGLAQIEFYSGASMLLEGPAELQLISADQCFCRNGKLRVVVPRSALGFTVLSPDIDMVDLGTEFGVEVTTEGNTRVHVFDGKVELYPPDAQRTLQNRIELLAGSGQHIKRSGTSLPIVADPQAFVSSQELQRRVDDDVARRAALWKQDMLALKQDSRFMAIYSFEREGEKDRILHNQGIRGRSLDGAIVGCEWSEGRWPGKEALEFKRPGDRVCIHVPGEYDALTLAGWVRVDGLDRPYSSLLLTDGYDLGEIHWQILRSGQLRLGICHLPEPELVGGNVGLGFDYDSPAIWGLPQVGRWVHVAVVVDNLSGFVIHFANGRELSREPLHTTVKLRIGDARIGNWRPYLDRTYKSAVPIRNFNGRIDELLIAGHALMKDEIQSLYQKGRPTGIRRASLMIRNSHGI